MSAVGCFVGPLMLLGTTIGYFTDADPVLAMMAEAKGPGEDFVFVLGGCNVTNVTFQLESYCVSGCSGKSSGQRLCRYYPEYHGVFVDDPTISFSEVFEDGVTEDGLSCREDPERPPAHAPQVGDVIPCWRSQLHPVSGVYRCLCRSWFRFCPAHQGVCAKFVDPADLWQFAELDRDNLLTTYGSLGLAAILLLLLPTVYIPWHCFKKRTRTKAVGTAATERASA